MSLKIAPKTLTCGFLSKIKENVILKTPETIPLKMVTLYFPLAFIQALSVCIIDKNTTDNDESFNIFIFKNPSFKLLKKDFKKLTDKHPEILLRFRGVLLSVEL